jgi:hypothetical protein
MKRLCFILGMLFCCSSHALQAPLSRRQVVANGAAFWGAAAAVASTPPAPAFAVNNIASTKLTNLSNSEFKEIIVKDISEHSFLTTGKITRSIYDESAIFQDEIDTYTMDKWILGTSRLFVGEGSALRLVGDVHVSKQQVEFLFDEDLMFNIPFKPKVHLTGKLVLERDPNTGLITKYREYWDQSVADVLKSAKI